MDMKRIIGLMFVVMLLISACSSNNEPVEISENQTESAQVVEKNSDVDTVDEDDSEISTETERMELTTDFSVDALPVMMQLVVGSLELEDTGLAVNEELATYLLPYWKLTKSLVESDTSAPEEVDAVIRGIQQVMTADQVNHIAGLQLTQPDMMSLANDLGIMEQLRSEIKGDRDSEQSPPGGGPGVGGGQGGPGRGGEGSIDPSLLATQQASNADVGGRQSDLVTVPLVEALISLLEDKTGN